MSKSFPAGKDFCPNSGDEKNKIMKFLGFSKIWIDFSLQIYFQEKKKFGNEIYFENFHLQILENPKNFMILFFHPLNLSGVVLGENLSRSFFFSSPKVCREKVF